MRIKIVGVSLLWMAAMLVSACGGAASVPAAATQPEAPTETVMTEKPAPTGEVMEEKASAEAMADKPTEEAMLEKEGTDEAAMAEEASTQEATMEVKPAEAQMSEKAPIEKATTEAMAETTTGDEAMTTPTWFNVELTDVNTGETFKIADLKGKVVLVETMAVWCPLCLQQQEQVRALHELVGEQEDFVSLALDIDPNEDAAFLKAHASQNGFDWRYAVALPEVSREISQLYGAQFLNPPSTPMLIIDRQGEVHLLPFGQKDAQTLQEAVTPLLNEG